jgi:hypothetical protein
VTSLVLADSGLPCDTFPIVSWPRLAGLLVSSAVGARWPTFAAPSTSRKEDSMIRKLADGRYRLYSKKKDPKTGKRRNLGTFSSRAAAEKHERAVQYFKRRG